MDTKFNELENLSKKSKNIADELRDELGVMPHKIKGNFIAFFGRQFNPKYKWNRVLKPLWSGFYIKYNDLELMVDPGINILERAQKIGVNLSRTNTLFISHAHIDHSHDANVIAEMVSYRKDSFLNVLMSKETNEERVMSHYHLKLENSIKLNLLEDKIAISLFNDISLSPIKVVHSINGSFGFVLDLEGIKIGYTGDTGFCLTYKSKDGLNFNINDKIDKSNIEEAGVFNDNLKSAFSNTDYLIFNLHDVSFRKKTKHNIYHSTVNDAIQVLSGSMIKKCFIEHFNPFGSLGKKYPKKVVNYLKDTTRKDVVLIPLNGFILPLKK